MEQVQRKQRGGYNYTEPTLPPGLVVDERGVRIEHYYRSGDHGPPHLHVTEGGADARSERRIGQNGLPLENEGELTGDQRAVVFANRSLIRRLLRKIGRWYWFQHQ
ncbi:MAG: hypothetical protein IID44_24270 [Planctomycetes bacterium]|nr:hypothetical protein [Planctomycetota bacterium]